METLDEQVVTCEADRAGEAVFLDGYETMWHGAAQICHIDGSPVFTTGRWIFDGCTTMMWRSDVRNDHESEEEASRVTRLPAVPVCSESVLP